MLTPVNRMERFAARADLNSRMTDRAHAESGAFDGLADHVLRLLGDDPAQLPLRHETPVQRVARAVERRIK